LLSLNGFFYKSKSAQVFFDWKRLTKLPKELPKLADCRFLCLGTKGSHIRNIIKFSGSSVKIAAAEEEAATEATGGESPAAGGGTTTEHLRKVTVVGTPESQWKAQYLIFEKLREEGFNQGMEDVKLTVEIMVPSSQV
jgi:insulin-like growth factor 2 mRNA-binding protein 1